MAKILIVEDVPETRMEYGLTLEPCGENILLYAQATWEAIRLLKENQDIDIVILDRTLRWKTRGDEVAAYLKTLWLAQSRNGAIKRPLLVTAATEIFKAEGAVGIYQKRDLLEILWDAENDNSFVNKLLRENGLSPKEPGETVQPKQAQTNSHR
ncbi:MAG: response regulator [Alphaproteobacteria bacterium]|nr:response regulator [Alphaproteobacteria bacterium]